MSCNLPDIIDHHHHHHPKEICTNHHLHQNCQEQPDCASGQAYEEVSHTSDFCFWTKFYFWFHCRVQSKPIPYSSPITSHDALSNNRNRIYALHTVPEPKYKCTEQTVRVSVETPVGLYESCKEIDFTSRTRINVTEVEQTTVLECNLRNAIRLIRITVCHFIVPVNRWVQ